MRGRSAPNSSLHSRSWVESSSRRGDGMLNRRHFCLLTMGVGTAGLGMVVYASRGQGPQTAEEANNSSAHDLVLTSRKSKALGTTFRLTCFMQIVARRSGEYLRRLTYPRGMPRSPRQRRAKSKSCAVRCERCDRRWRRFAPRCAGCLRENRETGTRYADTSYQCRATN